MFGNFKFVCPNCGAVSVQESETGKLEHCLHCGGPKIVGEPQYHKASDKCPPGCVHCHPRFRKALEKPAAVADPAQQEA